jgi:FkbM family methyltransferase
MIKAIKKIIPKKIKTLLRPHKVLPFPKRQEPFRKSSEVLGGMIAYNKYGGYFTPLSSQRNPAVQKIFSAKVFEPETVKFMIKNCGTGDIIHAGTFFGDFLPGISNALSKESKVWAFEPNIENFRCAQITCLINNLKNVNLHNVGLGAHKSTVKMLVETESGIGLGGMSKIINETKKGRTIDVEINLIDETVPKDRQVSIIQLDVEGYEKEALSGALETINRCKPIIILEDNNKVIETNWFAEHILKMGYEITGELHKNTLLTIKNVHKIK